jgi:hypothetical protein
MRVAQKNCYKCECKTTTITTGSAPTKSKATYYPAKTGGRCMSGCSGKTKCSIVPGGAVIVNGVVTKKHKGL